METILAASIPAAIAGFVKLLADNRSIKNSLNGQMDAKFDGVKDEIREVKADLRDLKADFRTHQQESKR